MRVTGGAVVTGGADGTGLAVALQLATCGARVHIGDIREEVLRDVLRVHPELSGSVADAGIASDVARLFDEAHAAVGSVHTLVNVVGIAGPQGPVETITDEEWIRTFAANVHGTFYAVRAAVPDMKAAGRGAIVNFSSGSTRTNMPNRLPYVASKWAVDGITRALARELGPFGIRVNAVLPGLIDNDRMREIVRRNAERRGVTPDALMGEYLRYISMRSGVRPEELAATVAFLCSDLAPHVTGQLLGVDGNAEWEP